MTRTTPETVGRNAGLALSRYVPFPKNNDTRAAFLRNVAAIPVDESYRAAFRRWKQVLESRQTLRVTAMLGGPLAVGLGNESPTEVGLTLHRVYGTPYIPGSALKGACLRAIAGQDATAHALFGTTHGAGYARFHDAWFVPADTKSPLVLDTVTVHHPQYYQKQGEVYPTDFDDPTPVPFLSVRPGAAFLFAIELPGAGADWLAFTEAMLRHTLTEIGVGGKTNAGYGWFRDLSVERPPVVLSPEEQFAAVRKEIAGWDISRLSQQAVKMLEGATDPAAKRMAAQALRERITSLKKWNKDTVDKPWRKAIEEALL